jgi:phosphoenolpyruvate-protein kinase (PTS system EI component)
MYKDYHPAVLRALARVSQAAAEHGTPISMCGDAAADPAMLDFFLGVGFRVFSVEPAQIPDMKRSLPGKSLADAQRVAQTLLGMETVAEVESFLHGSRG